MTPSVYLVFSQRLEKALDLGECDRQARRFFHATISPGTQGPDAEELSVAVGQGPATAERRLRARSVTAPDLALADEAELAVGGGLGLLAHRCMTVWEVERREDGDLPALRLAAVLASVLLGPIVDPCGPEIFGVKTARAKLDRAAEPR